MGRCIRVRKLINIIFSRLDVFMVYDNIGIRIYKYFKIKYVFWYAIKGEIREKIQDLLIICFVLGILYDIVIKNIEVMLDCYV